MTAITLLQLVGGQLTASIMTTVRTFEAIGPAPRIEGVKAFSFSTVVFEEFVETEPFLELNLVARHRYILFVSYGYVS